MERSDGAGNASEREKEKRNIAIERWRERESGEVGWHRER